MQIMPFAAKHAPNHAPHRFGREYLVFSPAVSCSVRMAKLTHGLISAFHAELDLSSGLPMWRVRGSKGASADLVNAAH